MADFFGNQLFGGPPPDEGPPIVAVSIARGPVIVSLSSKDLEEVLVDGVTVWKASS